MTRTAGDDARRTWAIAGVGVLAGFIAGLFGVGGGILIAPGLVLLAGLPQKVAHGTSLAATAILAGAGIVPYALDSEVDYVAASLIFAGSVFGVLAGVELLDRARTRTLRGAFVVLLGVTAGRMLAGTTEVAGDLSLTVPAALALAGCGVVVGLVAGLMGVGGGVVIVPALVLFFEMGNVAAKGTSLMVILPTAVVGTLRNVRHGHIDLRGALVTGVGGVASAFGGALLAGVISPQLSSGLFAGLLLLIAAHMLRGLIRGGPGSPGAANDPEPPQPGGPPGGPALG